jgi:hypothetical protein
VPTGKGTRDATNKEIVENSYASFAKGDVPGAHGDILLGHHREVIGDSPSHMMSMIRMARGAWQTKWSGDISVRIQHQVSGGEMSVCLGRFRRVVDKGMFAVPGRNLLVFDDALVLARAKALDGYLTSSRKNMSLEELSPHEIVGLHPDNWMVEMSAIKSASLQLRRLRTNHRLDFETDSGVKTVAFENRANPARLVSEVLTSALGERLSIQKVW